ncbi:hypothetical protein ACTSKR_02310 [Chitinibacteraceae bacterium HSL-7]
MQIPPHGFTLDTPRRDLGAGTAIRGQDAAAPSGRLVSAPDLAAHTAPNPDPALTGVASITWVNRNGLQAFDALLGELGRDTALAPGLAYRIGAAVADASSVAAPGNGTGEETTALLGESLARLDLLNRSLLPPAYRQRFAEAVAGYRDEASAQYTRIELDLTRASAALARRHGSAERAVQLEAEVTAIEAGRGAGQRRIDAIRAALGGEGEPDWSRVRSVLLGSAVQPAPDARTERMLEAYRQAAALRRTEADQMLLRMHTDWQTFANRYAPSI